MANIPIKITSAGIAELINAEQNGTLPIVLAEVGIGSGQYEATEEQTSLQAEFKRLEALSGGAIGDNTIHVSINDSSYDAYTVYEMGVYTASGTLFAVYSQTTPILTKAAASHAVLAIDMVLTNLDPDSVTVGDTNFYLNAATTTKQGIVELATDGETINGTDGSRAVTPASLHAKTATAGRRGLVQLASNAEAIAGTNATKAVTPAAMLAAFVREHGENGFQKLPGGLIMQWGKALIAPDGSTSIKFPTSFPTEAELAFAISADSVQASYGLHTLTKGAVSFKHDCNGGVSSRWFAIGR